MGESRISDITLTERTLADIQRDVDEYISQFKEGYFSPLSMLARMTEEVGELAREVNHHFGEKPKKKKKLIIPLRWNLVIYYLSSLALQIL